MGEVRPEVTRWLTTEGGVAADLRRVFTETGLSQAEFARQLRWSPSKVSRYLSGKTVPSTEDVRWWCVKANAVDEADQIVSKLAGANLRQFPWRQRIAGGYTTIQEQYTALHARCELVQMFELTMIPGPLQTPAYAEDVLVAAARFYGADPSEAKQAATQRAGRTLSAASTPANKYRFVVHEPALLGGPASRDTMDGQVDHFASLISEGFNIGVIPLNTRWRVLLSNSFAIYTPQGEEPFALVESFHGEAEYTTTGDVSVYQQAFDQLAAHAKFGNEALALTVNARTELR